MPTTPYRVQLDVFDGPLDLLLHLVKKNELEIADVPTATITEQYLEYLEMMESLALDVAGEYLVMAATLLLIKSRTLLPEDAEEEPEVEDPRVDLVRQLLEYQRYREAALALSERPMLNRDVFVRESLKRIDPDDPSVQPPDGPPPVKVTVWQLLDAMRKVLERARPEIVHEVTREVVTIRDRINVVLQRLSQQRRRTFASMFDGDRTKLQIIVTFLAMLELMKAGAVAAVQEEAFGEIMIELTVGDVRDVDLGDMDEYDNVVVTEESDAEEAEAENAG